ncbi:MAG: RlmF-related methyltransferase [Candidatus Heimdallarchaeota archaeon]|nr:RlmF-related methyltransferase [Candidatus Heimdallarchaeota archaeon]
MSDFNIDESIDIKSWCVKIETAVEDYPLLAQYVNKGKLDFGDHQSLCMYNKAVAYSLAKLDIDVPDPHLIPAVCLRYAYVKVIYDKFLKSSNRILEIGTGASAIISLFAAKSFDLNVLATEINESSIDSAERNISTNNMSHKIQLLKSEGGILEQVIEIGSSFDALLTYPPTYADSNQDRGKLQKNRGFKGVGSEMIGGGIDGFEFTKNLLLEACSDHFNIKIITVMCLFISHVSPSVKILENNDRKTKIVELIAGTRKRYIVIGY